ncbi:MAG TPA: transposase [Pseudonocardiaceae bacterium]
MSLVAGMVAGADSIEDMDRLRHGGNAVVFDRIRAPSTLGTFLRAFTYGRVQQLNAVLRRSLIALAERTPLLPGADQVVFVDLGSTHRQVDGYAKQGAAVGRLKGKKTLHPLLATASTPIAAPVVVATRMRRGKAADVRGAPRLLAEALATVRAIAPTARIVVRGDSKFDTAEVAATAARYGAAVSLTTGSNPSVNAAITQIPDTAWTAIHYPNAFVGGHRAAGLGCRGHRDPVSGLSFPKKRQVHGRLIVRRVKRLNPSPTQDGLFDAWRHHAVFVTSGFEMVQAESQHRAHAINRAGHRRRRRQRASPPALSYLESRRVRPRCL